MQVLIQFKFLDQHSELNFEVWSDADIEKTCSEIFIRQLRTCLYHEDERFFTRDTEEITSYSLKTLKASAKSRERNKDGDLVYLEVESEINATIKTTEFGELSKVLRGLEKEIVSSTKRTEFLRKTAEFRVLYNVDRNALITIAAIGMEKYVENQAKVVG